MVVVLMDTAAGRMAHVACLEAHHPDSRALKPWFVG